MSSRPRNRAGRPCAWAAGAAYMTTSAAIGSTRATRRMKAENAITSPLQRLERIGIHGHREFRRQTFAHRRQVRAADGIDDCGARRLEAARRRLLDLFDLN